MQFSKRSKHGTWFLLLAGASAYLACSFSAIAHAQRIPDDIQKAAALDPVVLITGRRSEVEIVEKLSKVVELKDRILRVDGFDPNIIDVKALAPNRIRVQAVHQGVTTLILTDEFNKTYTINVFVKGDSRHLQAIINQRFPDSSIEAYKIQDAVALAGWVSQPGHITQIVEIAEQLYPQVLNQMQVGGVQQVKIKVKIMEVQRSKLRRMGFNFLGVGRNGFISSTPGQLTTLSQINLAPNATSVSFTDTTLAGAAAAFGFVSDSVALQAFFDALKEEELLKILAEPILVTTNGRPAMMLSGGEFPILVPQSLGSVSIEWRDFGVRLEAVPVILGDGRVRMEVMPEVSERDFANSITLQGTTVPALTTRKVNTQVEMRFGQTLMLAGLLSSRQTGQAQKVPLLGELPWAGTFFRRIQYDDVETELVILLTPELVAPLEAGQLPQGGPGLFTTYPTDRELFFDGMIEVPSYGDECNNCGALGFCGPACKSGHQAQRQIQRFALPVSEETVPLSKPQSDALKTANPGQLDPLNGKGSAHWMQLRNQSIASQQQRQLQQRQSNQQFRAGQEGNVRQVQYNNNLGQGNRNRQAAYDLPSRLKNSGPRQPVRPRIGNSTTVSGRPGLIEP
jgi:pilus assembly protein CpaC